MALNTKQMGNAILSTSQVAKACLGIESVDQITFSKKACAKILTAQARQYSGFKPTGYFHWPTGMDAITATGVVVFTAMAMVDKDGEDFRFCHEDLASKIKFPDAKFASKYYRFMHGGQMDEKDATKGDDFLIKPDGLVHFYLDANRGLKDEFICKEPRTVEEISAEHGLSKSQLAKMKGDFAYSVYPSYFNKSYYIDNVDALESISTVRSDVAQALCRTNEKANQKQVVQVLVLGFISGYSLMTKNRNKSLELRSKGKDVPIEQYGVGMYMPAWTILSREIVSTRTDLLPTLRSGTGYNSKAPVRSLTATYKKLGLPYVDPVTANYKEVWDEVDSLFKTMTNPETIKNNIKEETKDLKHTKTVSKDKPAEKMVVVDKKSEVGTLVGTVAVGKRRSANKDKTDLLGTIPGGTGTESKPGLVEPTEKKAEPKETKRKRPSFSDLTEDATPLSRRDRK